MIIPFLESAGGNSHVTSILVEALAVTVKLLGAWDGTGIKQLFKNNEKLLFIRRESYKGLKHVTRIQCL